MRHALGVILLLVAGIAQAVPVIWTLDNVGLEWRPDGDLNQTFLGELTGSFIHDADTGTITQVNIVSFFEWENENNGNLCSFCEYFNTEFTDPVSAPKTPDGTIYAIDDTATGVFLNSIRLWTQLDLNDPSTALTNAGGVHSVRGTLHAGVSSGSYVSTICFWEPSAPNSSDDVTGCMDANIFGTISGSVVPIPAAVWLFGSGLIGLVGVARRKKA